MSIAGNTKTLDAVNTSSFTDTATAHAAKALTPMVRATMALFARTDESLIHSLLSTVGTAWRSSRADRVIARAPVIEAVTVDGVGMAVSVMLMVVSLCVGGCWDG